MSTILGFLAEISKDTKKSHKLSVIREHKDNDLFIRVIVQALNPHIQFYIRKIPEYVPSLFPSMSLDEALTQLELLSSRTLTGHAGIAKLKEILEKVSPADAIVIERIIGKDLRCGASDGIINAVIPKLIPTYPCLLARPYESKHIKRISYPALSQLKADGKRTNIEVIGNTVTVYSRSGKVMDFGSHFTNHALSLRDLYRKDCILDGELVVIDEFGIADRKSGNGIINKATLGTISEEEIARVRFVVWDIISIDEFKKGKSTDTYIERFTKLTNALSSCTVDNHLSWLVESRVVNSFDEALVHFGEMLTRGEEGTILKNYCGLWEDTRSPHIVKLKAELTCELEIIGYNEGKGQYAGQIGSLICASSDRAVVVDISGFTQAQRLALTVNFDQMVGKIITVKYNERISSKAKGRAAVDSLFLPRFVCIRDDKSVADSSAEIPKK